MFIFSDHKLFDNSFSIMLTTLYLDLIFFSENIVFGHIKYWHYKLGEFEEYLVPVLNPFFKF